MHSASWKKYLAIPTVGLVFVLAAAPKPRAQKAYEDRSTAKIAAENLLPGTDEDRIEFRNSATAGEVEAYGSALSVWPGEVLTIFARSSTGEDMQARVFRKGWYNGLRASAKTPWLNLPGKKRNGEPQPTPKPDPITGLVECQWESSLEIPIPSDWVTGVYLVKLVGKNSGKQSFVPFVVRDDSSSDILMQLSVTTYAAYNGWGGKSLYPHNSVGTPAVMVSLNKPFAYNGNASNYPGAGEVSRWELPMATFLERAGFDVSYCTDVDTHQDPEMLLKHKAFLCVGHDEYWSWEMRANVTRARDSGVDLGFFSGNTCYWQIRFAADSHGKPNRTIVCYKDRALTQDPYMNDGDPDHRRFVTVRWRDFPVLMPEDALLGVMYLGQYQGSSNLQFTTGIERTPWLSRGTGLVDSSVLFGLVGYEADSFHGIAGGPEGGHAPIGTKILAQSQVSGAPAGTFSHMSIYTAPSGALVFASGSMQWNWGLDPKLTGYWSIAAEQVTQNLLRRFISPPSRESVTLVAAKNPKKAIEGEPVTISVKVRGVQNELAAPTGVVELKDRDRVIALSLLSEGNLEVITTSLAGGRHTISFTYSGDDNFKPATSAFDIKVKRKPE
ncbi:MAG TPA: Ig-like domain-containing protein [Blastocatellia bacterium]